MLPGIHNARKRALVQRRRAQQAMFGAAKHAVFDLYARIYDDLDLPVDRIEWDADDYEDEREEIARRLVGVSAKMGAMGAVLRQRRGEKLTDTLRVSASGGSRAIVVPLESGVFLVAEAPSVLLRRGTPEQVRDAMEDHAAAALQGRPYSYPWTEALR